MFVVDLKRHNDGEDGLVGPFVSRADAMRYIEGISDDFLRKYAIPRPVVTTPDFRRMTWTSTPLSLPSVSATPSLRGSTPEKLSASNVETDWLTSGATSGTA